MARRYLAALAGGLSLILAPGAFAAEVPANIAAAVAAAGRPEAQRAADANRKPAEILAFAGVKPGDKTDPIRALIKLGQNTENFQRQLRECIGDVPMHQHEWDAIVSWAYNVGPQAACKSTLVRKLKAGDYAGACAELLRWDKFQGKPLPGLTKRRQDEHRQCMGVIA